MPNEEIDERDIEDSKNVRELRYIPKEESSRPTFIKHGNREYYPRSNRAMGYQTRPYERPNNYYRQSGPGQFHYNQGNWRKPQYRNYYEPRSFQSYEIPRSSNNQQNYNNYNHFRGNQYKRPYNRRGYLPEWRSDNYSNSYPQNKHMKQNYHNF